MFVQAVEDEVPPRDLASELDVGREVPVQTHDAASAVRSWWLQG